MDVGIFVFINLSDGIIHNTIPSDKHYVLCISKLMDRFAHGCLLNDLTACFT